MFTEKWISAWCSLRGTSHITEDLPCQDSCKVEYLCDPDFVIAAISDGAGSCDNSHIGSSFQVKKAVELFSSLIYLNKWTENNTLKLTEEVWRKEAYQAFLDLRNELLKWSIEYEKDFKSLSATLIVVVSNGEFIASANIGDGRAAFRNRQSEWIPILVPTKGEEANQTIFITSEYWLDSPDSEYFGTFFCKEDVTAFTLLSDGCERSSFEILKFNEDENIYFDPNKPYKPFFEPNYHNLLKIYVADLQQSQINDLWGAFLENGNKALKEETDDKSMILSVLLTSRLDGAES